MGKAKTLKTLRRFIGHFTGANKDRAFLVGKTLQDKIDGYTYLGRKYPRLTQSNFKTDVEKLRQTEKIYRKARNRNIGAFVATSAAGTYAAAAHMKKQGSLNPFVIKGMAAGMLGGSTGYVISPNRNEKFSYIDLGKSALVGGAIGGSITAIASKMSPLAKKHFMNTIRK
jgi:hypothetical protein